MADSTSQALLRIGALARRVGVSEHVLRAWERRYGVLRPVRTPGGFRLYSEADVTRIQRMQAHLAAGLSAAEAARAALDQENPQPAAAQAPAPVLREAAEAPHGLAEARQELTRTLDEFDESTAQALLDRLFADFTIETVLRDVVLPYLGHLGERWQQGAATIAQEHFASNLIRGRLAGLARGWGHGLGPRAILACAPGELHDLALLAFGIVLHQGGWRIDYLGTDTPIADIIRLTATRSPDLVVIVASSQARLDDAGAPDLARLAHTAPLALAGPGVTPALAQKTGATLLTEDPVTAAQHIAQGATAP